MNPSKTDEELQRIIAAVHCPTCGAPASYMSMQEVNGQWVVQPMYCCDTEDCEFHIDGPNAWIPDLPV